MSRRARWLPALLLVATAIVGACSSGSHSSGTSTLAAQGKALAAKSGCTICHGPTGQGATGPSWIGLAGSKVQLDDGSTVVADDAYIAESIRTPSAKKVAGYSIAMPPNQLSDTDITALVAYIDSLAAPASH